MHGRNLIAFHVYYRFFINSNYRKKKLSNVLCTIGAIIIGKKGEIVNSPHSARVLRKVKKKKTKKKW